VGSIKEVVVSLVFELLPVKVSLQEVRQPSYLGIGGIANAPKEIIDPEHEIHLALVGEVPGSNLHGLL